MRYVIWHAFYCQLEHDWTTNRQNQALCNKTEFKYHIHVLVPNILSGENVLVMVEGMSYKAEPNYKRPFTIVQVNILKLYGYKIQHYNSTEQIEGRCKSDCTDFQ